MGAELSELKHVSCGLSFYCSFIFSLNLSRSRLRAPF
jgi:hypothetical protein